MRSGSVRWMNERLHPHRSDSSCQAAYARMRRVPEDGGYLGSPAAVHDLRACRLLRFFEEQACNQALSRHQAPHHALDRAG